MKAKLSARSPRPTASFIEPLESRITPSVVSIPHVLSINRAGSASPDTGDSEVSYTVTFDQAVTGVDEADFQVFTSVDAKTTPPLTVTPTGPASVFNVKISGLQGNGDVRLDLVDDDTIKFGTEFLGDTGPNNGSFTGQTYHLLQTMPKVNSITATTAGAGSASWTVTFNEPVTDVDKDDFATDATGTTMVGDPLTVTPIAASNGARYTVTASGITGTGTVGLNLVDNGTIKDADKNPLQTVEQPNPPGYPGVSFGEPQSAGAGNGPISIASGDLNGDGKPDVAVVSQYYTPGSGYVVSVLLGNGDGSFQSKQDFEVGTSPHSVAVADVNGDGIPDLVVTGRTFDSQTSAAHFVSVLLGIDDGTGHGTGTFQTKVDYGDNSGTPGTVAVGDMNHDGRPDLAVLTTNGNSTVNVLLGNGDGTFQTEQPFPVNKSSNDVQIADVDGDGIADVITANFSDESVSVLLGTGTGAVTDTGSLGTATAFSIRGFLDESHPNAVAVGDMDGDGNPDLVTAGYYSDFDDDEQATYTGGVATVMLGDGAGNFVFKTAQAYGGGKVASLSDVQLADFDGDGKLDIALSQKQSPRVLVSLGLGDGSIGNAFAFDTTAPNIESLTVADFDGDGKADLATASGIAISGSPPEPGVAEGLVAGGIADALLNIGIGDFQGQTFNIVPEVDLTITEIDDPAFAVEYRSNTFTVHYANLGDADVSNGSITVTLPANTFFLTSPGWTDNMDGTITASGLSVPQGGADHMLSYNLFVEGQPTMPPTASLLTTAVISSADTDSDPDNNEAEETTPIYHGFVVTAPGISPKLNKYALPVVRVFDKLTGEALYDFPAYESTYRDSLRVALGDFNEDGVDDIAVTTQHNGGRLRFFDGLTGDQFTTGPLSQEIPVFGANGVKASKNKGAFVAVGDVNGTGYPEVVIGSSLISTAVGGGTVQVYSLDAVPGELKNIKEFNPFDTIVNGKVKKFKGGVRVAVADVDGFDYDDQGLPGITERPSFEDDIIVGQGYHGATVKVYKGTVINSTPGQEETFKLGEFKVGTKSFKGGVSVGADDIDHDGHADIIVGRNTGKPSVVEVFDGGTVLGAKLATKTTPAILPTQIGQTLNPFDTNPLQPKNTSGVRVAMADVNGDGIADIIASVGIKKNSLIKFYDGKDFRNGIITLLEDRTVTVFSAPFLDVALWVAASRDSVSNT